MLFKKMTAVPRLLEIAALPQTVRASESRRLALCGVNGRLKSRFVMCVETMLGSQNVNWSSVVNGTTEIFMMLDVKILPLKESLSSDGQQWRNPVETGLTTGLAIFRDSVAPRSFSPLHRLLKPSSSVRSRSSYENGSGTMITRSFAGQTWTTNEASAERRHAVKKTSSTRKGFVSGLTSPVVTTTTITSGELDGVAPSAPMTLFLKGDGIETTAATTAWYMFAKTPGRTAPAQTAAETWLPVS